MAPLSQRVTTMQIGAMRWMNLHFPRIKDDLGWIDLSSEDGLVAMCVAYNVDVEELLSLGRFAERAGIQTHVEPRILDMSVVGDVFQHVPINVNDIYLLPKIDKEWRLLDGRVREESPEVENGRRLLVSDNGDAMKAAVDVMMTAAQNLRLGRCRVDQCWPDQLKHVPEPARFLRQVMLEPFHGVRQDAINNLAREMVDKLSQYAPDRFPHQPVVAWSLSEVFDVCSPAFPQLCWTEGSVYRCFGKIIDYQPGSLIESRTSLVIAAADLEKHTLSTFLWDRAMPDFADENDSPCDMPRALCDGRHFVKHFTLDRAPPTLTIAFAPDYVVNRDESIQKFVLEQHNMRVLRRRLNGDIGWNIAAYDMAGAMFRHPDGSMYSRWIMKGATHTDLVHLVPGKKRRFVSDWWAGNEEQRSRILMVFLRRIEQSERAEPSSMDQRLYEAHQARFPNQATAVN